MDKTSFKQYLMSKSNLLVGGISYSALYLEFPSKWIKLWWSLRFDKTIDGKRSASYLEICWQIDKTFSDIRTNHYFVIYQ